MKGPNFWPLLFFLTFSPSLTAIQNDTNSLTLFRIQADVHGNLLSNWTGNDACSANWRGINCSTSGRVSAVFLPSLDLRGQINSLAYIDQLRLLDLHNNRLNDTIYPLTNCTNLRLLYLSGNDFSGEIPPEIAFLKHLLRFDLSNNNLNGEIPQGLSNLSRLLTIRLQNNILSGRVPDLSISLPNLTELNLSNNKFHGQLPDLMMKKFGLRAFTGNGGLCGSTPFPACSLINGSSEIVPSNPSSMPKTLLLDQGVNRTRKGLNPGTIVAIVIAGILLLVVTSFIVTYHCGGGSSSTESKACSEKRSNYGTEKKVYADSDSTDRSKLVIYDRRKQFELEDLLKASAEMLGKGSLGTVYKAVLENGCSVAVKRLKDANPCARKEFEQYMDVIGKIKHPNVVRLRAYYYAKEEKLLVYDYLPNGSLHSLLHGNRGPGRIPLDWTTRLSLVLGAARGFAHIHEEYNSRIPHGNLKSSNILLDKDGAACVSDFGLSLLLNPAHAIARMGGYRAPEQAEIKKLSHKSDIYSFGVLLLELLTGKAPSYYPSPTRPRIGHDEQAVDLPKWVKSVVKEEWTAEVFDQELLRYKNIEEELVSMLHVALACVAVLPEKRPTMVQVVNMLEDIRVEHSPLGDEYDESRNSVSPSMATTEDGIVRY